MAIDEIRLPFTIHWQLDARDFIGNRTGVEEFSIYKLQGALKTITNQYSFGGSEQINQQISFYPVGYAVRSLRAFISIISIEAVRPIEVSIEDSQDSAIRKNIENDAKYPFFWMYLQLKKGERRIDIGHFNLQNKRPGYYINLMPFLANNDDFVSDIDTEIIVSIQDAQWGFPGLDDVITIYGEVEQIGYISPFQKPTTSLNSVLSGSLTINGGSTDGNTVNNQFLISINSNLPDSLRIYFLPPNTSFDDGIDLISYEFLEVSDFSSINITSFLQLKGMGYYVIAPILSSVADQFWADPYISATVDPSNSATLTLGAYSDSGMNKSVLASLPTVHVLAMPTAISLVWA